MQPVCGHCHTPSYVQGFYRQYDNLVILYNEKFAKPGRSIVKTLRDQELMAPDYTHWHGMYEVAERFYQELVPQAREIAEHAIEQGSTQAGRKVLEVIDEILARTEHRWQAGE